MTPEELLKEVGEPFGYIIPHYADYPDVFFKHPLAKGYSALMARTKLYTSDQVAAAILKVTKPMEERIKWLQDFTNKDGEVIKILEDQLAKAEQRVSEACALQVATDTKFRWLDAARVAKEIRSGEWRKFVKEV